ncbi:MAG: hypothetical protein NT117_10700 [Gammaproteobacteria bacterium]|nr:hypothetical protein [Gammaproteobacteria bacterium]
MTEPDAANQPGLSTRTTPTWEMELLVSAGTIVGLLQLPSLLDVVHTPLLNGSSEAFSFLISATWAYCNLVLYTLIATFLAHLCLRAYWVALVGMDSVYPGGIRWEKMRMGPVSRALAASNSTPVPDAIEAADNRATRVFGIGFGAAMILLMPVVLALVGMLVAWMLDAVAGPRLAALSFYIVFGVVLVPLLTAQLLDQQLGKRLDPTGWPARTLTQVLRPYRSLGLDSSGNLLVALFASHEGGRRAGLIAAAFMAPVVGVLMISALANSGRLQLGDDAGWPRADPSGGRSVVNDFYGSLRGDLGTRRPMPFIPDRVASGDYLPLFVPFIPRLHTHVMETACPDVLAANRSTADSVASLDCLARISAIELDGKPVVVVFEASADPASGQRGMLAMLPVASLASGRHEISLGAPVKRGEKAKRYRIPFWK